MLTCNQAITNKVVCSLNKTTNLQYRQELNDTFRAKSTARFRTNLTGKICKNSAKSRRSFRERIRNACVQSLLICRDISRNIAQL